MWPIEPAGRNNDIELDMLGLPVDEAIAWARKPYPIADPTIFHTPDIGSGEAFSPNQTNLVAWFDATDSTTIDKAGTPVAVSEWRGKFGTSNVLTQATESLRPLWIANGLHHRPALDRPGSMDPFAADRYLADTTPTGVTSLGDFTIMAVAAAKVGSGAGTICGVWSDQDTERSWRLRFVISGSDRFVRFERSTAGGGGTTTSITNDLYNVPDETPVLIIVRRTVSTGAMSLTVNGVEKPDTLTGTTFNSTAPLAVFADFDSVGNPANLHRGWIQFVGVWNTNLDPASSEFQSIRSHWRRKGGVW
jgi:hypothetical protein